MQSLKELYKIGRGPSSSHTLAPERACRLFLEKNGSFSRYEAELYGSLSLTGKGHNTDKVIRETLNGPCEVYFRQDWDEEFPNGFYLTGYREDGTSVRWCVFSLGGGSIQVREYPLSIDENVYPEHSFKEIKEVLIREGIDLPGYVYAHESDLKDHLRTILKTMIKCVERGLHREGVLPGKLKIARCAGKLLKEAEEADEDEKTNIRLMAYAYAAGEENADGGTCVTAPTLGSFATMAALFYWLYHDEKIEEDRLIDALAAGGVFGDLIKTNATISGAVGGCQAEIGAAVSMASASYAYILGSTSDEIEYAAEIAMEHHLGLTCDPVMGYVMIPCIERNAVGVLRAIDAAKLARYLSKVRGHLISFDMVVKTMNETGKRIAVELRETSEGGLAKEFTRQE